MCYCYQLRRRHLTNGTPISILRGWTWTWPGNAYRGYKLIIIIMKLLPLPLTDSIYQRRYTGQGAAELASSFGASQQDGWRCRVAVELAEGLRWWQECSRKCVFARQFGGQQWNSSDRRHSTDSATWLSRVCTGWTSIRGMYYVI